MKPIIIRNYEDLETISKINAELNEVQKKAKVRTISALAIMAACKDLDRLFGNIPKKYRNGITSEVDPHAKTFPGAYRGIPESTQFKLTYKNGTWRLTDVCRKRCQTDNFRYINHLPEETQKAIVDSYSSMAWI